MTCFGEHGVCGKPDSDKLDTFKSYTQAFIDYLQTLPADVGPLPTEQYSTQRYVDPNGCDHSSSHACGAWAFDAKQWLANTIFEANREFGAKDPALANAGPPSA